LPIKRLDKCKAKTKDCVNKQELIKIKPKESRDKPKNLTKRENNYKESSTKWAEKVTFNKMNSDKLENSLKDKDEKAPQSKLQLLIFKNKTTTLRFKTDNMLNKSNNSKPLSITYLTN
jgi:hypothetical protein